MAKPRIKLASLLLCLVVLGPFGHTAGVFAPYNGRVTEPALDLLDLQGNRHRLEDYRGRVVLVNFWASWCGPCVTELPGMQRLQRRMDEADRPFTILAVDVAEPRHRIIKFIRMLRLDLTVLLDHDSRAFEHWGARVFPTSYLVDTEGCVRYRVAGPLVWDGEEAIAVISGLIDEAQGDGPPAPAAPLTAANSTIVPD